MTIQSLANWCVSKSKASGTTVVYGVEEVVCELAKPRKFNKPTNYPVATLAMLYTMGSGISSLSNIFGGSPGRVKTVLRSVGIVIRTPQEQRLISANLIRRNSVYLEEIKYKKAIKVRETKFINSYKVVSKVAEKVEAETNGYCDYLDMNELDEDEKGLEVKKLTNSDKKRMVNFGVEPVCQYGLYYKTKSVLHAKPCDVNQIRSGWM